MKKNVICALGLLALMSLASCSAKDTTNVSAKIVVWAPAEEEAVIKEVVDAYNAKMTDDAYKFNYTFKAVSEADGGTTLAADPQVTGYPSLVAVADDQINNLVSKNILNPLGTSYTTQIKADDTAFAVTCVTNGEKLYGFPITSDNGYFLWYNSAALSATDVKDLGTILSKAKAGGKKFLMDLANGWYANSLPMAKDVCGTDSLKWTKDAEGKISYTVTWDSDAGVKALTAANTMIQPYFTDKTWATGGNAEILKGFTDGSMIAAVSGTWMEKDLAGVCSTLAAVELPSYTVDGTAHHMGSFSGTKAYVVNGYASVEEQTAALKLGKLLTSKEAQITRFSKRAAIPCNNDAAKDATVTSNITIGAKALAAQAAYAAVQSTSAESRYWDIGKAIGQAVLDGKLPDTSNTWASFLKTECDTLRKNG
jgi:arabinogalactan oligomer/maltooligosaccharide transport system substrate-binding protein